MGGRLPSCWPACSCADVHCNSHHCNKHSFLSPQAPRHDEKQAVTNTTQQVGKRMVEQQSVEQRSAAQLRVRKGQVAG